MVSSSNVSRQMAVPFAIDSSGSVSFITDPNQQLLDRVVAILATDVAARLMRPEFGLPLRQSLFSAFTDEDAVLLVAEAQAAVTAYEPGVHILGVNPITNHIEGT